MRQKILFELDALPRKVVVCYKRATEGLKTDMVVWMSHWPDDMVETLRQAEFQVAIAVFQRFRIRCVDMDAVRMAVDENSPSGYLERNNSEASRSVFAIEAMSWAKEK